MSKIIIEVGSTCTKVDEINNEDINHITTETIQFKKNFKKDNKLNDDDVKRLIELTNKQKELSNNIYACGTSVFRNLTDTQREEFLKVFKKETNLDFDIISPEKENELTMKGATKYVENKKVAVFVGGGGSTEIAVYEDGVKETVNSKVGVIDIMNLFPDLAEDFATTDIETVKEEVRKRLNLPKEKADILILAGGGHKFFALNSGIKYVDNTLYEDSMQPIMMDIELRKKETERYYKEISLDEIRNKSDDPNWWYATRGMCAFVLVVAETIGAKYIVPTDISMVHGLI